MQGEFQDTAMVCKNGHLINDSSVYYPEYNTDYCESCGEKVIDACPNCQSKIRGAYHLPDAPDSMISVPKFCPSCGQPYPWTELEMQAAKELIEFTALDELEKEAFKSSLEDIIVDTPKTKVAGVKIKMIMSKISEELRSDIKEVLTDIGTNVALEAMGIK